MKRDDVQGMPRRDREQGEHPTTGIRVVIMPTGRMIDAVPSRAGRAALQLHQLHREGLIIQ